jgi:hypothetical protein
MTLIPSSHRTGANYSNTITIFCYESLSAKEMGKELRQHDGDMHSLYSGMLDSDGFP